jgi:hypothetical protein
MKMKIYLILMALLVPGCASFRPKLPQSPAVSVSNAGVIGLSGDAKTPAKVDVKKTDGVLRLPEASRFVFNEKTGEFSLTLSKATEMVLNRTETHVDGPVAFTPPKQPTASELSDAKSDYWVKLGLYACVLIGGCGAIFGLVKDWNLVMYGGLAILGSGLFGLFVQRHPLLLVLVGLGIALKFAGPWLYHTKLKHLPVDPK